MNMRRILRKNALLMATVISVVLGIVVGALVRPLNPSSEAILLVGFPGELFLRMLKMLMLPLIVASIITGVGNLKEASAGRMGMVSLLYYIASSFIALLIALTLGLTIKPGAHSNDVELDTQTNDNAKVSGLDMFLDLLRNTVPANIVEATLKHTRTAEITSLDDTVVTNASDKHDNISVEDVHGYSHTTVRKVQLIDGTNIIGVLLYCVVFGVILGRQGRKGLVVARFFAGLNTITLQMIQLVMWYSPVGILFLIASQVMAASDLTATGHTLGVYMVTEIASEAIHMLVVLPILYFVLTRENAFKVYTGALQALFTALATSSSAATLPVTIRSLEKKLKMDPRICGFVLPIGATVNMDAGTIYFVLSPIFIAQYNGVNLSFTDILIFSLTGLLSGVGSAAIPGSGYAVLLIILSAVGLPDRGLFILFTIDWLTDRIRTAVNVASDCLAVGVTSRYTALPPRDLDENTMPPESVKALQEMEGSPVMPSLSSTRLNMEPELDTLRPVP